ncbi:MAG TPA: VOC family protein [Vicinamibacterales bacterium]|nr:VOC family protein [Vicinamibacterales bacterium]
MSAVTGSGVTHVMLGVSDLGRSIAFYEQTLGRAVRFKTDGIAFIDGGAIGLGLSLDLARARQPLAGAVEVVFSVPDVHRAWRDLTDKGVSFFREPRQVTPTDWAATFLDPDGHFLTVFGPKGETESAI